MCTRARALDVSRAATASGGRAGGGSRHGRERRRPGADDTRPDPPRSPAFARWRDSPVEHVRDLRAELMLKLLFHERGGIDPVPLLREQALRPGRDGASAGAAARVGGRVRGHPRAVAAVGRTRGAVVRRGASRSAHCRADRVPADRLRRLASHHAHGMPLQAIADAERRRRRSRSPSRIAAVWSTSTASRTSG